MEKLTVDAEGRIVIPREIIQRRGLHPGDALALVEVAEGLLVYQGGADRETLSWWNRLSEDERRQAAMEARQYEALSEAERTALWSEAAESLDAEAEGDEVELPTPNRPL